MNESALVKNMRVIAQHKIVVGNHLQTVINALVRRAVRHDTSKFSDEEFYPYAENLPRFESAPYGSDEYKAACAAIQPAIDHHFQMNRHHPEHFTRGINEMTLIDLIEMVCDWLAASQRVPNGELRLDLQKERFGLDDQLYEIIANTVRYLQRPLAEDL